MITESFISRAKGTLQYERSQFTTKKQHRFRNNSLLFITLIMIASIYFDRPGVSFAAGESARKLSEEFSSEEKARHASELMAMGDQLTDQKDYENALAAYEQVFVFDPNNTRASAKIDLLKKQVGKEQKDESGIVTAVYEQEASAKVHAYWADVQKYLQSQKFGQARLTLEKILILDPMNEEAQKLYQELRQPNAVSPDETGKAL